MSNIRKQNTKTRNNKKKANLNQNYLLKNYFTIHLNKAEYADEFFADFHLPVSQSPCPLVLKTLLPKTSLQMIIHHPGRLHKGITNCASAESKSALFHVFRHGI